MSLAAEKGLYPMSSQRLFWMLPVAAVLLCAVTIWERGQSEQLRMRGPRGQVTSMRPVVPNMQFELYDTKNRTVRLARYLGRHRIDLVFLADRVSLADEPVLRALKRRSGASQGPGSDILLIVSQRLPQSLRRETDDQDGPDVVVLSDVGGRRGQVPGGAARAWRVLDRDGKVAKTSWFVIDRAGRVEWSDGGPAASQAAVRLED